MHLQMPSVTRGSRKGQLPKGRTHPAALPDQLQLPHVQQGQPGRCNLEKHPRITVKREDMGKFWSFSWSQAAFSSQNTLWLTSPASALALLVGITLGTLRYPNSQSVLVALCPYSFFQKSNHQLWKFMWSRTSSMGETQQGCSLPICPGCLPGVKGGFMSQ